MRCCIPRVATLCVCRTASCAPIRIHTESYDEGETSSKNVDDRAALLLELFEV